MKTILQYYCFDLSRREDREQNRELAQQLKDEGLKCYRMPYKKGIPSLAAFVTWLQETSGFDVALGIGNIYPDRWQNVRHSILYDWCEFIHAGSKIKEGYWLLQTNEMRNLRDEVYTCPRCNRQFSNLSELGFEKMQFHFCLSCVTSPAMTERELYTAFLRPVSCMDIEVNPRNIIIPKWIHSKWSEAVLTRLGDAVQAEAGNAANEWVQNHKH